MQDVETLFLHPNLVKRIPSQSSKPKDIYKNYKNPDLSDFFTQFPKLSTKMVKEMWN